MPSTDTLTAWHLVAAFIGGVGAGLALAAWLCRNTKPSTPEA